MSIMEKMTHFSLSAITAACLVAAASYGTPAVAEDVIELSPLKITGERDWHDDGKSYNSQTPNESSGLAQTNRDTPQSISTITKKQIKQQKLTNIDKALQQSNGISKVQWGHVIGGYNSYYSRGFSLDKVIINGITSQLESNVLAPQSTGIYDAVSVLRGPTGLMSGVGDPGGAAVLQRKMPQTQAVTELEVRASSWHNYAFSTDVARSLDRDNTVRARLVAEADYGKTWQHWGKSHSYNLYGVIDFLPTNKTKLFIGTQLSKTHGNGVTPHGFQPYDDTGTKRSPFNYRDDAATRWSHTNTTNNNIFFGLEQRFKNDWQLKAEYSYTKEKEYRFFV